MTVPMFVFCALVLPPGGLAVLAVAILGADGTVLPVAPFDTEGGWPGADTVAPTDAGGTPGLPPTVDEVLSEVPLKKRLSYCLYRYRDRNART